MIQRREKLGLALEPRQALFVSGELLRKYFDGHVTAELRVASAVDLTHPALADRGPDLIRPEARSGGK